MNETEEINAISEKLDALKQHDWPTNWKTADELAQIGPPAVPRLIEALKNKDAFVREAAANALGTIGDRRAAEPLIRAMQYRDEQIYAEDEDYEARATAALALGKIGGPQVFEALTQAITDDDWQLSWYAIDALGMLGDQRAIPVLLDALEHKDPERGKVARTELVKFGEVVVPALIDVLKDSSKKQPRLAIEALGRIGDARALELLSELSVDQDERIRYFAARSLKELMEKSHETPGPG